jgi:hypothetical protein
MSAGLPHLVRRFGGVLRARPLRPAEQDEVAGMLAPGLAALFWAQQVADQRHGLECARAVLSSRPGRADLARAALLHDVGKRHAGLGTLARSLASGAAALRLPTRGRWAAYLRHGSLGAADLEARGADAREVAFARAHHATRPESFPAADWEALLRADRV